MDKSKRVKERILEEYNSILDFSKQVGIPCSTLQSAIEKENGIDNMATGRVLKICDVLSLDPYTMRPLSNKRISLEEDEEELLEKYRKLDEHARRLLNAVIDVELERTE